jgi:hypothetical protein
VIDAYKEQQKMADFRTGAQLALLANIYRDEDKKSSPFTPFDFGLPFLVKEEPVEKKGPVMQAYETAMRFRAMNAALGGKEVNKDG